MEQLWLNSPPGFPYSERIERNDHEQLRRFVIQLFAGNKDMDEIARSSSPAQIVKILEDSHFTFDPVWYGPRGLEMQGPGGRSALDDPEYRISRGIGHGI